VVDRLATPQGEAGFAAAADLLRLGSQVFPGEVHVLKERLPAQFLFDSILVHNLDEFSPRYEASIGVCRVPADLGVKETTLQNRA